MSQSSSQTDDSLDSIVGSRASSAAAEEQFSYHARIPQPADKDYILRYPSSSSPSLVSPRTSNSFTSPDLYRRWSFRPSRQARPSPSRSSSSAA